MIELTEDALVQAVLDFRDPVLGVPLHATKVICGPRAALRADRILYGLPSSLVVQEDPRLGPDEWRIA